MNADILANEIIAKRTKELQKKISQYPRRNFIMSDISPCERYLCHSVLDHDKRPLHGPDLQARFDIGNLMEREIIREIEGLGFKFVMAQKPVELKAKDGGVLASGRVDGFIEIERVQYPVEIKSMNTNVYDQLKSIDDLNKKPWLKRYLYQIQLYMYSNNIEQGLMIFTNCLGGWKVMPIFLDYGLCEWILQKLESAYQYKSKGEYGPRITYDQQVCGRCPFAHICLPDIKNEGLDLVDNDHLIELRRTCDELKPQVEKYIEADEESKEIAKSVGKDFIVGTDYKVELKKTIGTRIDTKKIPIEERPKYEVATETVKVSFVPLSPNA